MQSTPTPHAVPVRTLPLLAALASSLMGCSMYQPGTLGKESASSGTRHTVGCLDVAVDPISDKGAQGPAAKVRFGNRCNTSVFVDFPSISGRVYYRDGHVGASAIYDPKHTLRAVELDARRTGWEAFEYQPLASKDNGRIPRTLCLELSRMDRDRPSPYPVEACVDVDASYRIDFGGGL